MPNSAKKIVCLQFHEIEDIQEIPLSESRNYTLGRVRGGFTSLEVRGGRGKLLQGIFKVLKNQVNHMIQLLFVMPPTLKKLMGHIAFGACVRGCVRAWVTPFVPTVTFKPLKLES